MKQSSSSIFMVRPAHFGYNEQTALSNTFQNEQADISDLKTKVLQEFDTAVCHLRDAGIDVWVIEDTEDTIRPDAVFPNNWISTHEDGTLVLYPMLTPNRRAERRMDVVDMLKSGYDVRKIIDLSAYEIQAQFLEGTGSIVFDHNARIAYACLSPRTNKELLEDLCENLGYTALCFHSVDVNGIEVYHTNVIMGIGTEFAVVCLESIIDETERERVREALSQAGKEIIAVNFEQVKCFAGNVLEVQNREGKNLLVISQKALDALDTEQISSVQRYCTLVPLQIPIIETIGGGSVRCMLAQNFLLQKETQVQKP